MRVTNNSYMNTYLRNLENVSTEKIKNQMRIATSKDLFSLSEGPDRIVDIKQLNNRISENETFVDITNKAISELQLTHDSLVTLSDYSTELKALIIDASSTASSGSLTTLGIYTKGILEDMISVANKDYNGKCLFGGTDTRPEPGTRDAYGTIFPYELVEGEPSEGNPSGLSVIYKGNQEGRFVPKDLRTTEQINIIPEKAFGEGGTELFESVIDICELLKYKLDGEERSDNNYINVEEVGVVNQLHIALDSLITNIDAQTTVSATAINRLTLTNAQLLNENVNLGSFRSKLQDTDIASESIELTQNDTALQYALKVGANIARLSLFDYI